MRTKKTTFIQAYSLILTLLLVGCSSTLKKAGNLMESGAYEQAIPLYEQILREDPKNEEAIIGLKTARESDRYLAHSS